MDNRIPSLDGLRALSIALVIAGHSFHTTLGLPIAGFGVYIFFAISGYLITRLLLQEQERHGSISLRAFYRRRCFRIFPAAFVYIGIIAVLIPGARSGLPYASTYTVSYHLAAMPADYIHLWSLSIEEQFYLLWPVALALCFRRRVWFAWSVMGFCALFRFTLALHPSALPALYMHYSPFGAMDEIAAGCLLAIYEPLIKARMGWMAESPAIVIAVPLVAFILSMVCFTGKAGLVWGAVPLLITLFIFLSVQRKDWIFNNRAATAFGVLSYSLYLWQEPFSVTRSLPLPLALSALVCCAAASYFLIERPMIQLGKGHFLAQPQPAPVPLI